MLRAEVNALRAQLIKFMIIFMNTSKECAARQHKALTETLDALRVSYMDSIHEHALPACWPLSWQSCFACGHAVQIPGCTSPAALLLVVGR